MSKNIVIITGSPRSGGNTDLLAEAFIEGAKENGNLVTRFDAGRMTIKPCQDCQYCFSHEGECCQKDEMQEIYKALYKADMLVLASPVYWFGLSAQIKTAIDRFYVHVTKAFPIKETALLLVYADTDTTVEAPSVANYKAIIDYLGWKDRGVITQSGVEAKGDIKTADALQRAYGLGKQI